MSLNGRVTELEQRIAEPAAAPAWYASALPEGLAYLEQIDEELERLLAAAGGDGAVAYAQIVERHPLLPGLCTWIASTTRRGERLSLTQLQEGMIRGGVRQLATTLAKPSPVDVYGSYVSPEKEREAFTLLFGDLDRQTRSEAANSSERLVELWRERSPRDADLLERAGFREAERALLARTVT